MHCSLFIPDFFSIEAASPGNRLAAAEMLSARGRRVRKASSSPEAWLFERFGVRRLRDWPVAPYTLLADGGTPGRSFWMRADPVHLTVGRDSLDLDAAPLEVSRPEADALVATLNRHFGGEPAFHALQPKRWYVAFDDAPEVDTTQPSAARGAGAGDKFPAGAEAMRFRALMNEVQMLLHEHPANAEREAHGVPAVNSVWFWGGGALGAPAARPFSTVLADDPLPRGLALAAGASVRELPASAEAMLSLLGTEGVALVVLASPGSAALERDWFAPLLAALEDGRIGMLSLALAGGDSLLEVETARSDLRHFWRTRKPLHSYIA